LVYISPQKFLFLGVLEEVRLPQIRRVLLHGLHFQLQLRQVSLQLTDFLCLGLVALLKMSRMAASLASALKITSTTAFLTHGFFS
jgi:hypothetical protein